MESGGGPHTHFGAGATCLYTLIPYNTNKIILTITCFDHISGNYSLHLISALGISLFFLEIESYSSCINK